MVTAAHDHSAEDSRYDVSSLPPRIERLPAVLARTGLARSTLYAAVEAGEFPEPLPISARAIGFLSSEIDEWIASRSALRVGRGRADASNSGRS